MCLYFAFLGGFRGVCGVCVGLCGSGALRGLCGFCTRVELGGFMACCVFASIFPLLCLSFYLFACFLSFTLFALFWLSFACPLVLSCLFLCLCGLCVFFFPCGLCAKRKGAKVFPCVLSSCVVGCFIWLLLCIPRTRQVSARLYRNKVLKKGNLIECSKLFCARLCFYLCSSKFVFLLFSYLLRLVGSCFLFPFGGVLVVILLH